MPGTASRDVSENRVAEIDELAGRRGSVTLDLGHRDDGEEASPVRLHSMAAHSLDSTEELQSWMVLCDLSTEAIPRG